MNYSVRKFPHSTNPNSPIREFCKLYNNNASYGSIENRGRDEIYPTKALEVLLSLLPVHLST